MSAHHSPVDVGTPASGFEEWKTTQVRYHGFADLTTTKGQYVASPEFTCLCHRWRVEICPGGGQSSDDGMVGIYLRNMSAKSVNLVYGFSVKDSKGKEVTHWWSKRSVMFEAVGSSRKNSWGRNNVAKRSKLLDALVARTLVVEVRMKCADSRTNSPPFVAENPLRDLVLKLFMDDKTADIMFEVGGGGQQHPDSKKRSRTEPVEFHAHRLILKQSAPMLAALCPPGDGVVTVSITDVAPEVFRPLLFYLYGGEASEEDYKSNAREIIEAADRFEVVGLKLAAEAWYARSTEIDLDNVMELLFYSDAKNLALLKETVMDFIVDNREDVLKRVPLGEIGGGLFADLLAATGRTIAKINGNARNDDLSTMRISDLRRKLHAKGLGPDGSREMLIAALEQNE